MEWDSSRNAYTFTTEEDPRITIIWTPDNTGENKPWNTGNQNPVKIPDRLLLIHCRKAPPLRPQPLLRRKRRNLRIIFLSCQYRIFRRYIFTLASHLLSFWRLNFTVIFVRRSRQGKYEADHMPSKAAVKAYLKAHYPEMTPEDIELASQDVAAIVIPKKVHPLISGTYGGRNTFAQIQLDSKNLRSALDRDLDAIKPALKEHGATENQIESARSKMHKLNSEMGLYK